MHAPQVCWGLCINPMIRKRKNTENKEKQKKNRGHNKISKKTTEHEIIEDKVKDYSNAYASKLVEAN